MPQARPRWRWAVLVAALWALLPLLYLLPADVVGRFEHAIFALCLPAAFLSYVLLGGVHSDAMVFFPWLCSLLTFAIVLAVGLLVLRWRGRAA